MKRGDFRFFHRLRVRWAEVDMQKIVFNGHHLTYFDSAVADYWRALALPYEEVMHSLGGDWYVKKATVEYCAPARYDDSLDVGVRCASLGRSSMLLQGGIFRGDQLLNTAELVYVFANPSAHTPIPIPDVLRSILEGFEAKQAMTHIRVASWQQLGDDAARVRTEVFVQEQGIPRDDEWDEADRSAVHAVVYNRMHAPLATGRLLVAGPQVGRIGRMACKRVLRGSQLGRQVLEALIACAKGRGDHEVLLHAQTSAAGFYAKSGFLARGEPFDEVGIPHIEMFKTL